MLAFFGGGFDPVHYGHINSAKNAIKKLDLTQLFLLPYYRSPDKQTTMFSDKQRLDMLEIATKDITKITIDTREISQKQKTYTIDSLLEIRNNYKKDSICLLLGADSFNNINKWRQYQDIIKYCHLVIINRPNNNINTKLLTKYKITDKITQLKNTKCGLVYLLEQSNINISSSDIRYKIKHNKEITQDLPPQIIKYLQNQ